jgi:peroxiredoxin-like protein
MVSLEPRKYEFRSQVKWTDDSRGVVSQNGTNPIKIALPKELEGPGGAWSPDEMYVASVEACAMLTFFWLIKNKNVDVLSYESNAKGISQIADDGLFRFVSIELNPKIVISNPDDKLEVKTAIQKLDEWCCISNSSKAPVIVNAEIVVKN